MFTMRTAVIDAIEYAAERGWLPADLLHVAPNSVDLLREAQPGINQPGWETIPAAASPGPLSDADLSDIGELIARLGFAKDRAYLGRRVVPDESAPQAAVRRRVAALLAKAASTTFPEEAEALLFKAHELQQKHRLEEIADDAHRSDQAAEHSRAASHVRFSPPWVRYQYLLLSSIAGANQCASVLMTHFGIASLVGHPDDIRHVELLFESLNHQRDYFMRNSEGARLAKILGETASYRRSFMVAYAYRIGDLLTAAHEQELRSREDSASLLPVLAGREATARSMMEELFPHCRSLSVSSTNLAGCSDGYDAADKSCLDRPAAGLPTGSHPASGNVA